MAAVVNPKSRLIDRSLVPKLQFGKPFRMNAKVESISGCCKRKYFARGGEFLERAAADPNRG